MDAKQVLNNILKDTQVKLSSEFDLNFTRKAFFDQKWKSSKYGMQKSGNLRRSIASQIEGATIRWSSSLPYASIHNNGGIIKVTLKMKKYFWAKYYELAGKIKTKKDGSPSVSQYNQKLSVEAQQYKYMALMKVGTVITMPKRQFIGSHPEVTRAVKGVIDKNMQDLSRQIKSKFKP